MLIAAKRTYTTFPNLVIPLCKLKVAKLGISLSVPTNEFHAAYKLLILAATCTCTTCTCTFSTCILVTITYMHVISALHACESATSLYIPSNLPFTVNWLQKFYANSKTLYNPPADKQPHTPLILYSPHCCTSQPQ